MYDIKILAHLIELLHVVTVKVDPESSPVQTATVESGWHALLKEDSADQLPLGNVGLVHVLRFRRLDDRAHVYNIR